MIQRLRYIETLDTNPIHNLSLESVLFDAMKEGEMVFYLWQNENTIVIGKNQNVYQECNLAKMKEDGVTLVRRPSGGGAVYHDLGNLNFTFIAPKEDYSVERQSKVIIQALESFGIHATLSGRNDLLVEEKKFSGNAYFHRGNYSLQHGTLLIHSDLSKMPNYLVVDPKKIQSKGIQSVRSRVMNLNEVCPTLTIDGMKEALKKAITQEYGLPLEEYGEIDQDALTKQMEIFGSESWIYNDSIGFQYRASDRYDWGGITLEWDVKKGMVCDVNVYSDSMYPEVIDLLQEKMKGCSFSKDCLIQAISPYVSNPMVEDIISLIQKQTVR